MNDVSVLIQLDVQVMVMVSAMLIPILHGVLTKISASDSTKVVTTLVLTAVAALVQSTVQNEGVVELQTLVLWGANLVVTIAVHYGVYKPIGITGSSGAIQRATAGRGIIPPR